MIFGIGFWECLLILLVALIAFPPHRLPELATTTGRCINHIKQFFERFKHDI